MAGQLESLDTDEGLARRRHRHWYDRLMMLSDGVFAIAITLLAADITPPTVFHGGVASLWATLAPQLDAYALSFVVISVYWLAHRRFMAMILTVDAPVTILTLAFLGLVALLPAFTRLTHFQMGSGASMLIYGGLVVSIGVALAAMWGYAALIAGLVSGEVPTSQRWYYFLLILLTPPFFLLLTRILPAATPGLIPLTLVVLFLIGASMRRWIVSRLGGPS
jgi:uncharacterized membrane protein